MSTTSLVFLLMSIMLASPLEACSWTASFKVRLVNELPEDDRYALVVHCRSGDDDLGYHIIGHTQDYKWGFCEAVFDIRNKCKFECTWKVRDDGFYLQNPAGYTFDRYMGW
ncbi:hypothetical protein ACS0TY_007012 [Phlomoides rotata]